MPGPETVTLASHEQPIGAYPSVPTPGEFALAPGDPFAAGSSKAEAAANDPYMQYIETPTAERAETVPGHNFAEIAAFRDTAIGPEHEAADAAEAAAADPGFYSRPKDVRAFVETIVDEGRVLLKETGINPPYGKIRRRWVGMDKNTPESNERQLPAKAEAEWSQAEVISDINERLQTPMGQRKGSEVTDLSTGEKRKPCIELYCSEEAAAEVSRSLAEQEKGLQQINSLLDLINVKAAEANLELTPEGNIYGARASSMEYVVPEDDQQRLAEKITRALENPDAFYREWVNDEKGGRYELRITDDIARAIIGTGNSIALQSGILGSRVEVEGLKTGGDMTDLYMRTEDVQKREDLAARLQSSSLFSQAISQTNIGYFLQYNQAERVQACVEGIIPEGTELFHSTKRVDDIIASGRFGTRLEAGLMGETETGTHSNLLHFGEVGKINGHYGNDIIGVPIEKIVERAPYIQQENGYEAGRDKYGGPNGSYSQHLGKVELPTTGEGVALVVRQRVAKIKDRFENGVLAQGTNGGANNITFAASREAGSAGQYSFDVEDCSITHIGSRTEETPAMKLLKHQLERAGHSSISPRVVSPNNPHFVEGSNNAIGLYQREGHYASDVAEKTDLHLASPKGIMPDRVVGFAPISTKVLGWSERTMISSGAVTFETKETLRQRGERLSREQMAAAREQNVANLEAEAAARGVTLEAIMQERADKSAQLMNATF